MGGDPEKLMEIIMNALQASGYTSRGDNGDALGGMDPGNQVKGWSGISLTRGPDDRPALADKDYIVEKLAMDGDAGQTGEIHNFTSPF